MPDPVLVRLGNLWPRRRVGFILVGLILIISTPLLSYHVMSYYSVSRVSVQIISGTRTLGSPIEYMLEIRVSSPGAMILIKLWPPTATLTLDAYNLAGVSPYAPATSSDFLDHLSPGDTLTYRGFWKSSFSSDPSADMALSQTDTNHLLLYVYFHEVNAGWYNEEIVREISTTWTWPS